jgi:hypothetical protein
VARTTLRGIGCPPSSELRRRPIRIVRIFNLASNAAPAGSVAFVGSIASWAASPQRPCVRGQTVWARSPTTTLAAMVLGGIVPSVARAAWTVQYRRTALLN